MAPARTHDTLPSVDNPSNGPDMKKVLKELQELDDHVQRVLKTIQSPEMVSWLGKELHDPDQLPDQGLEDMALKVVDSMDQMQLQLVPSVSLLTDGFFGRNPVI